jgi:quinohemoprotein ethanol dehydrogenase
MAIATGAPQAAVTAGAASAASDASASQAFDRDDWLSVGRTTANEDFSPLTAINESNVNKLSLAGYYDIPTHYGQEATPLAINGRLYFSTDWSIVKAVDGRTGTLLWSFDPHARRALVKGCCGPVSRGVAYWRGRVFVGALDGRLIALNAKNGRKIWEVQTTDPALPYTITGAPLVADGKVIIGNGGADMGPVRGYVSAYDTTTGQLVWRFYTVPGHPAEPDGYASDLVLRRLAAPTWHGQYWNHAGGGTVWNGMSYDPHLDLLYVGTGNGAPWNEGLRSQGQGDNLFTCSILALKPETGRYVWHYQTTPGDAWDFDADEQMTLADLRIDGRMRRVLMQASKNGFFYVLDRATGKLISARGYVSMSWSRGIDSKTGRPIVAPQARYFDTNGSFIGTPSAFGAHSWQSMAFSPATGLTYFSAQQLPLVYSRGDAVYGRLKENLGVRIGLDDSPHAPRITGWLVAWNPVTQRQAWHIAEPEPFNGGVLATAGGLVFQGDAAGQFAAYAATSGHKLWTFPAQSGIVAAPIAYEDGGSEYIALLAGWGGGFVMSGGARTGRIGPNRLLIFKLRGQAKLPTAPPAGLPALHPPTAVQSASEIATGQVEYSTYCSRCHGANAVSGGDVPDLRYSSFLGDDIWFRIVLHGLLADNGMADFSSVLDRRRTQAIRAYVIDQAQKTAASERQH